MMDEKNRLRNTILIQWFDENQRTMPWRETKDPYAIWVSEVMLQQTRVEAVIPFYMRWMEQFPNLTVLAESSQEDVLKVWEGLGYYFRGRNLHKAAQFVVEEFGGKMPKTSVVLQKLPGIGRYTAAAVASIAYDEIVAVVDGNVKRVLSRWFDFDLVVDSTVGEKYCWALAEELIPELRPGDHNQAMMEFGALICLPKNPNCANCVVCEFCLAFENETVEMRPVKKEKKVVPTVTVGAAVMMNEKNEVLIAKRPQDDMLGGMWEFSGGKQKENETIKETIARELMEELNLNVKAGQKLGTYRHAYSHFKVILDAYYCEILNGELQLLYPDDARWVDVDDLDRYPMSKIDRMIANDLKKND